MTGRKGAYGLLLGFCVIALLAIRRVSSDDAAERMGRAYSLILVERGNVRTMMACEGRPVPGAQTDPPTFVLTVAVGHSVTRVVSQSCCVGGMTFLEGGAGQQVAPVCTLTIGGSVSIARALVSVRYSALVPPGGTGPNTHSHILNRGWRLHHGRFRLFQW